MIALFLICGAVWALLADLILTADLLRSEARIRRDIARGTYMYGMRRTIPASERLMRRVLWWSTLAMLGLAAGLFVSLAP